MKYTRIPIYIDFLFCAIIIPLVITLLPVDKWIVNNRAFLITLIVYIYGLYTVYRIANIPQLFMQKKYLTITILLAVLIAVTVLFTYFPMPNTGAQTDARQMAIRIDIRTQTIWVFFLMITGFSLAIELLFELFRQILSKQEIEAEKNKAELALYKAQINPHFLFNTLNTLYAMVVSGSDKTESAFVKFSDILRYMYTQAASDTIPIGSEIAYIRQYVDLQMLRLNRHTHVDFTVDVDNEQTLVPPMILITFVENAFKYGTSPDTDCTIYISISLHDNLLRFETENSIMQPRTNDSSAIGIDNCRKRLGLLYPGRFELESATVGNIFRTSLNIRLK